MFRYLTSYRWHTLAKAGFVFAYLWFVADFFRIHLAIWNQLALLLPGPSEITFVNVAALDAPLRSVAVMLNTKAAVWGFLLVSPAIGGLYLWGRHRWLQVFVGAWMSFSMIALTSLAGVFNSTADVWLNYVFVCYFLAALICPTDAWERREPGFSLSKWRENPTLASTYAWLIVLLQFTVYFFAGINKLVYGWDAWTTGTALQHLAVDSSMRDYVRGIHVPYAASLILSYVTLFQRLIVPFGFYFRRCRIWSALILGSMHVGYFILMKVAIFPVIGIASLLMVIPPHCLEISLFKRAPSGRPKAVKKLLEQEAVGARGALVLLWLFPIWLLLESARLTVNSAMAWENKLMVVPAWRMFADGGAAAGDKWQLILQTPQGETDATELAMQSLPHLWRDRFYIDLVLHTLLDASAQPGGGRPGPLLQRLFTAAEKAYGERQTEAHADPTVYRARFAIYHWQKPG